MSSLSDHNYDTELIESLSGIIQAISGIGEAYLEPMQGFPVPMLYIVVGSDFSEKEVQQATVEALNRHRLENGPKMVASLTGKNRKLKELRSEGFCIFRSETVEIVVPPEKPWWKFW